MVSTHLKNISQIGSFPQIGLKKKTSLKPPPRHLWNSICTNRSRPKHAEAPKSREKTTSESYGEKSLPPQGWKQTHHLNTTQPQFIWHLTKARAISVSKWWFLTSKSFDDDSHPKLQRCQKPMTRWSRFISSSVSESPASTLSCSWPWQMTWGIPHHTACLTNWGWG